MHSVSVSSLSVTPAPCALAYPACPGCVYKCRPCPVGLSVAQVLRVDGRTLLLGGADIVDGSPVLDIKPYIPFCDSVPQARAPGWVSGGRPA